MGSLPDPWALRQLWQLLIQRGREDELLGSLLLHSLPPPLPPALSGRKSERSSPAPCLPCPCPCPGSDDRSYVLRGPCLALGPCHPWPSTSVEHSSRSGLA